MGSLFCCDQNKPSDYNVLVNQELKNLRIYFTEAEGNPSSVIIHIYLTNDSAPFPFPTHQSVRTIITYDPNKGTQGEEYFKSRLWEDLKYHYGKNVRWVKVPEPRTKYKEIKYFMYKMVVETLMNFSSKLSANNQHLNVTLMWPSVSRKKREEIIKDVLLQRITQNKDPL